MLRISSPITLPLTAQTTPKLPLPLHLQPKPLKSERFLKITLKNTSEERVCDPVSNFFSASFFFLMGKTGGECHDKGLDSRQRDAGRGRPLYRTRFLGEIIPGSLCHLLSSFRSCSLVSPSSSPRVLFRRPPWSTVPMYRIRSLSLDPFSFLASCPSCIFPRPCSSFLSCFFSFSLLRRSPDRHMVLARSRFNGLR